MKFYAIWLSLICIIMFILQLIIPGFTEALLLNNSAWLESWRFITSIFLHGSLIHLILNLFALLLFGLILEKLIGSKKFLIVFFASGIIANLIAINFYPASLGASGAIFGIIGALTVIRPLMMIWVYSIPVPMFIAAIIWIIANIIQTLIPSNVGTIAHLSGIVVGMILGFFFREKTIKEIKEKIRLPEDYMQNWENRFMR